MAKRTAAIRKAPYRIAARRTAARKDVACQNAERNGIAEMLLITNCGLLLSNIFHVRQ